MSDTVESVRKRRLAIRGHILWSTKAAERRRNADCEEETRDTKRTADESPDEIHTGSLTLKCREDQK